MKTIFRFVLCLSVILFSESSCSSPSGDKAEKPGAGTLADSIAGCWKMTSKIADVTITTTYDFRPDGQLVETVETVAQTPSMNITSRGTCKYTVDNGEISYKLDENNIEFTRFEMDDTPAAELEQIMTLEKKQRADIDHKISNIQFQDHTLTAVVDGRAAVLEKNNM